MTSLLDSVAPSCSRAAFAEKDWAEECEQALKARPVRSFALTLALTGLGLVGAVLCTTALASVPLCMLLGVI